MFLFRKPWLQRPFLRAMEGAFSIHAGIRGFRSKFSTPAEGDWAEGKGRLAVRGGWRFLHLEGTPREMGLQHGRLIGPLIRDLYEAFTESIRFWRRLNRRQLLARGRGLEPHIPDAFKEEMAGIAEGACMAYEDILIGHTFLESIEMLGCSCYAAYGAATRSGEVIFGRNLDFFTMGVAHKCNIIGFFKPQGGIPFVSLAWPGWCGTLTAANTEGLCVGPLNVTRLASWRPGQPYVIQFRRLVQEARNCREAVEMLRATKRTYPNNVLMAQTQPERGAVVAEYHSKEVVARRPRPGNDFIAATNHFRKLGRPVEWPEERGYHRYPALVRRLQKESGHIALKTDILGDPEVRLPISLHTLVVAPERREFRVSLGRLPAAAGPYRRFRYDESGIQIDRLTAEYEEKDR